MRTSNLSKLDPDGGLLCFSVHWRPNPEDPDPDMPGHKLTMISYIPLEPGDVCLCGSGKIFSNCCQPKTHWHPICLDPGAEGYSSTVPQSTRLHPVDGTALREQFMKDRRLYCSDESIESSFWTFWGDPVLEDQYGILCFGDFELKQNRTLIASAMSDVRMQNLLNVLKEVLGEQLGEPEIKYDQVRLIDKLTGRSRVRRTERRKRRKKPRKW
jgi:hypothetical protein